MLSSPLMYLAQGEMLCYQKDEEVGPSYLAKKGARILFYSLTLPLTLVDHIVSTALHLIVLPFHHLFPTNPLVDRLCYLSLLQNNGACDNMLSIYRMIGIQNDGLLYRFDTKPSDSLIERGNKFLKSTTPFFSFESSTTKQKEL